MLEVVNLTNFAHLAFGAVDVDDEMHEVVVAKGAYALAAAHEPDDDIGLELTAAPAASVVLVVDEYFGAVNKSSVRVESDLAPFKPRCDIVVIGSAHSPTGRQVTQTIVGLDIESAGSRLHAHRLVVHGARDLVRGGVLDRGAAALARLSTAGAAEMPEYHLSEAEPFLERPLRYEMAFGGELKIAEGDAAAQRVADADRLADDVRTNHPDGADAPIAHRICRWNPVGQGFVESWYARATRLPRYPAPCIEAPASPLTPELFQAVMGGSAACETHAHLAPQGFGIIAKPWQPRLKLAGTYDEEWRTTRWPYLPKDFDMAYWNGAHPSMQCPHLAGGETVTLTNLLRHGEPGTRNAPADSTTARFRLPSVELALRLEFDDGRSMYGLLPIDTLVIDLDAMLVHIAWRLRVPSALPVRSAALLSLADERVKAEARSIEAA